MSERYVYLVLGSEGAGRRELLADMIGEVFAASESIAVALAESEPVSEVDSILQKREATNLLRYESIRSLPPDLDSEVAFVIGPGRTSPADAIESFRDWLRRSGYELARVLAIVDCRLGAEEPALADWFDCMVHFADVVLLNRREGLSPKWPQDFCKKYESLHYPCMIEYVKKGQVSNPARVLDPVARRMALLFDEIDAVDQIEIDPDNLPEEPIDLVAPEDPWLERNDGGSRVKALPDVAKYLDKR